MRFATLQIIQQMYICGGIVGGLPSAETISCTVAPGGGHSGIVCAPSTHKPVIESNRTHATAAAATVSVESMSLLPYNSGITQHETTHRAGEHVMTTNTEMHILTSLNEQKCEQAAPIATATTHDDVTDSLDRVSRGGKQVLFVDYRDDA